jgi:hypothetical protein
MRRLLKACLRAFVSWRKQVVCTYQGIPAFDNPFASIFNYG